MSRIDLHRPSTVATILGAFFLAACADTTGTAAARAVSLSFSSAPASIIAADAAPTATAAADPLVITKAQVVFSRTELALAGTSSATCASDDCAELRLGPMLVELPVGAGVTTPLTVAVPAGTYRGLEARVDSVRVEGTYNGEPFVFTSAVDAKLELTLDPPLVVDGTSSNVTVQVDLASWFRDASGARIDPRTANDGGSNRSIIEGNIKQSFRGFEDRDRDGRDG